MGSGRSGRTSSAGTPLRWRIGLDVHGVHLARGDQILERGIHLLLALYRSQAFEQVADGDDPKVIALACHLHFTADEGTAQAVSDGIDIHGECSRTEIGDGHGATMRTGSEFIRLQVLRGRDYSTISTTADGRPSAPDRRHAQYS